MNQNTLSLTFEQFLKAPLYTLPADLVPIICDDFIFSSNSATEEVALSLYTSVPYYFEKTLYFFNTDAEVIGSISATLDDVSDSSATRWKDIIDRAESGKDFVPMDTKTEEGITVYEEAISYLHEIYETHKVSALERKR